MERGREGEGERERGRRENCRLSVECITSITSYAEVEMEVLSYMHKEPDGRKGSILLMLQSMDIPALIHCRPYRLIC